jgi:hypothetical protein
MLLLLKLHIEHKIAKAKKMHMLTEEYILHCASDAVCLLLETDPLKILLPFLLSNKTISKRNKDMTGYPTSSSQ